MNHRVFILTLLSLAGCGGSGGPGGGGPPVPLTVEIPSTVARDGYVRSDGYVGTVNNYLFLGDGEGIAPGLLIHAVVGFDLAGGGIPPGATIQTAVLILQQSVPTGNPYTDLGNVLVDHVNLGAAVDTSDFSGNTLLAAIGVLSTDTLLVLKTLDVGAQVQADLAAGRTTSDFRLRFTTDTDVDGFDDLAEFIDTENSLGEGQPPHLKVIYLP